MNKNKCPLCKRPTDPSQELSKKNKQIFDEWRKELNALVFGWDDVINKNPHVTAHILEEILEEL